MNPGRGGVRPGPAYLVSVGYMDPGNWATDLEGGARFGYQLLWVLVMSNLMAILLQTLSARLGIVRGRDLAQACREHYPRPVNLALWVLCEIAIAACEAGRCALEPSEGFLLQFAEALAIEPQDNPSARINEQRRQAEGTGVANPIPAERPDPDD